MDKDFSIELSQREAEALNTLMPNGHSFQIFEKYERRKKAEKKLDDIYVAEFSLRPSKKMKKENEVMNERGENNPHGISKRLGNETHKQKSTSNNGLSQKQENPRQKESNVQKQKLVSRGQKQRQQMQFRTSRSHRVSRPTEAYMQFQEEAFRRKFIEKDEPKMIRDNQGSVKRIQEVSKVQPSKQIPIRQQSRKISLQKGLDLIELKSLIAEKIQKRVNNKTQHTQKERASNKQQTVNSSKFSLDKQGQNTLPDNNNNNTTHLHTIQLQSQEFQINRQTQQNDSKLQPPQVSYQIGKVTKRQQDQAEYYNNSIKVSQLPQLSESIEKKDQQAEEMPQTRNSAQKNTNILQLQKVIVNPSQLTENQKLKATQSNTNNSKSNSIQAKVPKVIYNLSTTKQPTLTRAFRILQRLKAHKSSWPFRYPVDPVSQGVPDYLQKIKQPMDLKTIEKKLRNERYRKEEEFFSDVELMLRNSYTYNPQSSNYYKLTCQFQTYFNELKGKSYIPKSSVRNIAYRKSDDAEQQDEGQDYDVEQGNQQQEELEQQDMGKNVQIQDIEMQKSLYNKNQQQKSNYKRVRSQTVGKREGENQQLSKVMVNNYYEGKRVQNVKDIQVNKISKVDDTSMLRSDITEEKGEEKKKEQQGRIQQCKQQGENNKQSIKQQKGRIGYGQQWSGVPIVNRECLFYDILNLKQQKSQQQLYEFIKSSKMLMDQLVVRNNGEENQEGDKMGREQQCEQQQLQFELGDLDMEGYKLLRQQVSKLLQQQQQRRVKKTVERVDNNQQ